MHRVPLSERDNAMAILVRLKGKKDSSEAPPQPASEPLATVHDEHGRKSRVERGARASDVRLPNIEKAWGDPEALYLQILEELQNGFARQVTSAAERLVEIDARSERSRVLLSVVRMENGDLAGSERELETCMEEHGRSGIALAHVARLHARRGDHAGAIRVLQSALEVDPNQEHALVWWAMEARARGGEEGYLKALEELGRAPDAWRPQLWLARARLEESDVSAACALYEEVLAKAAHEPQVLMMISGDLGTAGALAELVSLVAPHYDPARDGPEVGFNLIEAYKRLGRVSEAREMVRRLQELRLAPLAERLGWLERELG